jgi:hypothetical protein
MILICIDKLRIWNTGKVILYDRPFVDIQVRAGEVRRAGDPGLQRQPAPRRQGPPPLKVRSLPPLSPQRRLQVETLCRQNAADQPGKKKSCLATFRSVFNLWN